MSGYVIESVESDYRALERVTRFTLKARSVTHTLDVTLTLTDFEVVKQHGRNVQAFGRWLGQHQLEPIANGRAGLFQEATRHGFVLEHFDERAIVSTRPSIAPRATDERPRPALGERLITFDD